MRGTAGLLAVAAMAASALAGDAPPEGKGAAAAPRDPALQAKIDAAIEKGVAWLRTVQGAEGGFAWNSTFAAMLAHHEFGTTALAVHALRSCGVPADDPAVTKGLARMRRLWKAPLGSATYETSIALLALEAHYAPAPTDPGGELVPGKPSPAPRNIPEEDLDWIGAMARRLAAAQAGGGGFGYGTQPPGWTDLSNTQYALLGLKAAIRCGVPVKKEVFRRAAEYCLGLQERTGERVARKEAAEADADGYGKRKSRAQQYDYARGFGYQGPIAVSGSMTSAGISSLVICRGELLGNPPAPGKVDALLVQAIRDGLAWLGANFSVLGNPARGGASTFNWHYYYLYGLERAGVLAGVRWVGNRDWYVEGATYLVRAQEPNGGWQSTEMRAGRRGGRRKPGDLLDTCFALLFLKKATFRVEGAVATEEADDALDLAGAATLDDDSYRAVFDSVFARWLRAKPGERGKLGGDFLALGVRAIPLLIRLLEDAEVPRRAAAAEALHRLTGESQGFVADAPDEVRAPAVAAWEAWWFARRARLVPDPASGRFRDGPGAK